MKKSTYMLLNLCCVFVAVMITTHVTMSIQVTRQMTVYIVSGVLIIGAVRFYLPTVSFRLVMTGVICAAGILYGAWFSYLDPDHPIVSPGTKEMLTASVQKVKIGLKTVTMTLNVTGQGEPIHHSSMTVFWTSFGHREATVPPGMKLRLNGYFESPIRASDPIRNWLSPSFSFQGKVISEATQRVTMMQSLSNRMLKDMESGVPTEEQQNVSLALSMVIGRSAPIPTAMQTLFQTAGVTHLLAASGANVVLFCQFIQFTWRLLCTRLPVRLQWLEYVILLCAIWIFVSVCGFVAPMIRAGILASYTTLGRAFQRETKLSLSFVISCLLFICVEPYQFTSVSGIFSVVATFAMMQALEMFHFHQGADIRGDNWWYPIRRKLLAGAYHCLQLFLVSLVIDAYMVPLVWWWFQQFTPYGAISTVVAEPFVAILVPLTLLWGGFSLILGNFQSIEISHVMTWMLVHSVGRITLLLVRMLVYILTKIAAWPHSLVQLPALSPWYVMGYFSILLIYSAGLTYVRNRRRIVI